jgi:hypothetical protein
MNISKLSDDDLVRFAVVVGQHIISDSVCCETVVEQILARNRVSSSQKESLEGELRSLRSRMVRVGKITQNLSQEQALPLIRENAQSLSDETQIRYEIAARVIHLAYVAATQAMRPVALV